MEKHIVIKEYKENSSIIKKGSVIIIHENQVEYFVKQGIIAGKEKTKTNKETIDKKEVIEKKKTEKK
jgi:membrane protease subunit (stomatin/prohibitin family)